MSVSNEVLIVLNSSRLGQGNPRLGESLMTSFLESVLTGQARPVAILLYNSAVVLATDQSPVCPVLKKCADPGIDILVNQESLEFYSLDKSVCAGHPASMDEMTQRMMNAATVVKP